MARLILTYNEAVTLMEAMGLETDSEETVINFMHHAEMNFSLDDLILSSPPEEE